MKNYIVRVYRAPPFVLDSVSGVVEDIDSGQINTFHSLNELHALLANSIRIHQFELPYNSPPEEKPGRAVAVNA